MSWTVSKTNGIDKTNKGGKKHTVHVSVFLELKSLNLLKIFNTIGYIWNLSRECSHTKDSNFKKIQGLV